MTDPAPRGELPAPPLSPVPVPAPLSKLAPRADGTGAEREPVRQARLAALARLAEAQPAAIRSVLDERLQRLGEELQARLAVAAPAPGAQVPAAAPGPLAELLAYIGQQASAASAAAITQENGSATVDRKNPPKPARPPIGSHAGAPELKAVAYFRDAWSRLSTEQQLTQTLAQAPENAGPMNSQHLVLRSLQAMRDLAPDYLQGFMSYIDTLIWLEQLDPTRAPAKTAGEGEKKPRAGKRTTGKRPPPASPT